MKAKPSSYSNSDLPQAGNISYGRLPGEVCYIWDTEQNTFSFEGDISQLTGYTCDELKEMPQALEILIDRKQVTRISRLRLRALEQQEPYKLTYNLKRKDDTYCQVLDQAIPLEGPSCTKYTGILTCIDENQQDILNTLREQKELLHNIVTHNNSLFYTHTPEGQLTYVSQQSRQLLGCEPEQAKVNWQDFITSNPMNNEGIKLTELALKTGQKQAPYKLELKTFTNREVWVEVDESPIIKEGKVVGIVGSLTDVTEKIHLEEKLLKSNEEYRALNEELATNLVKISQINAELEKAKNEITLQRELLDNIIDNLPIGLQIFDDKGNTVRLNKSQRKILGIPDIDNTLLDFNIFRDTYSKANDSDKRYRKAFKGNTLQHEFNIDFGIQENNWDTRKDIKYVRETVFPVYTGKSKPSHIIALLEDITQHKLNEQALRQNEETLRIIINSSPVGIAIYLSSGEVAHYNKKIESITGYSANEIPNISTWFNKVYPDPLYREFVRSEWDRRIEEYKSGKPFVNIEAQVTCKNHSTKNAEFGFTAVGELHITTIYDITERVKAKEELERIKNLLSQNEKLSKVGAWEYNTETKEMYWSKGLYEIHEIDPAITTNLIEASIECYHKEYRAEVLLNFQRCIEKGIPYDLTVPFTTLNNNQRWVRTITRPILKNKKIIKLTGSVIDITELKQSENALRELNATKDKLFSIIAHDLKSPIGAMIGVSQLALAKLDKLAPKDIEKYLKNIQKSSTQTFNLLNNLLDWSMLNAGKLKITPVRIDMRTMVEDIEQLFKSQLQQKQIHLNNSIHPEFELVADEKMIETVLRNLISNAVKFTNEKGSICVKAEHGQNQVVMHIINTGQGIEPEIIDQLFISNDFYSTRGTANEKGSGLGLKLCHDFIERHQGQITAHSQPGISTTFSFTIPQKH